MSSRKQVMVRGIPIGGGAPVVIQSMCNVDSRDGKGILDQIRRLEEAGCQIVRLAVPNQEALQVFSHVRQKTDMPLVADIHFDWRMAVGAIEEGAYKIRINPGNIGSEENVRCVVDAARAHHVPIRVGVNSGSVEKDLLQKYGHVTPEALAESAVRNVRMIEDMGFDDLVVSIKSSDVQMNYDAHKIAAQKIDHPFHIGITEAGTVKMGKIKSAAGIGALLLSGIGDTLRVSLTADPVEEVIFARNLLESIGLRQPAFELVSCPTCGRTRIPLQALAESVERRLSQEKDLPRGLKIAVMGCVVNGPGEAAEADYGICGGDGKGIIFAKGKVLKTVREDQLEDGLIAAIREGAGKIE